MKVSGRNKFWVVNTEVRERWSRVDERCRRGRKDIFEVVMSYVLPFVKTEGDMYIL